MTNQEAVIEELESLQRCFADVFTVSLTLAARIEELKKQRLNASDRFRTETVTIPVVPPPGLLESMALREDHGFAMSADLSDEQIEVLKERDVIMKLTLLTSKEREGRLTIMRQIHEEVVGKGFFRYE